MNGVALQASHVSGSNSEKAYPGNGTDEAKERDSGDQDAPGRKDPLQRSGAREVEEPWPAGEKAVANVGCQAEQNQTV